MALTPAVERWRNSMYGIFWTAIKFWLINFEISSVVSSELFCDMYENTFLITRIEIIVLNINNTATIVDKITICWDVGYWSILSNFMYSLNLPAELFSKTLCWKNTTKAPVKITAKNSKQPSRIRPIIVRVKKIFVLIGKDKRKLTMKDGSKELILALTRSSIIINTHYRNSLILNLHLEIWIPSMNWKSLH